MPELADVRIEWRSPLAKSQPDGFHEMRDDEFLHALDLADRVDDLKRFWPVRGPQWDGSEFCTSLMGAAVSFS